MVLTQIELQRLHHSDDFFFADFLAAAQSIFVRTVVQQSVSDKILASKQQSGALRTSNCFPAAEGDEVVAHLRVFPQVRDRRRISRRIIHARNLEFLRQLDPFINFDLSFGICKIAEVHHRCALVDGIAQLLAGFDHNQFHPGGAKLVIEWIAMRLLNDDF